MTERLPHSILTLISLLFQLREFNRGESQHVNRPVATKAVGISLTSNVLLKISQANSFVSCLYRVYPNIIAINHQHGRSCEF